MELVSPAPSPPDVGRLCWAGAYEAGLLQHPLGADVGVARRRMQGMDAVLVSDEPTQLPEPGGGHAATRDPLGDPVAHRGHTVGEVVEVEPTDDPPVVVERQVVGIDVALLVGETGPVVLREVQKVVVTAVSSPRSRTERAKYARVRQLEFKHRRLMLGAQPLQIHHDRTARCQGRAGSPIDPGRDRRRRVGPAFRVAR